MKCFIFILISILMVQNIIESAKVITQQDTVDCIAVNKSVRFILNVIKNQKSQKFTF